MSGLDQPISVEEAIRTFQAGSVLILIDDVAEGLGDLIAPGELINTRTMLALVEHGGGIVWAIIPEEQCNALGIPLQAPSGTRAPGWMGESRVSVEAREGVTTGISAADRARTVRAVSNPRAHRGDLVMPGHVLVFGARAGGTLAREGVAEATVELARHAGLWPACASAEILNSDGSRAGGEDLQALAVETGTPLLRISDVLEYLRAARAQSVPALRAAE